MFDISEIYELYSSYIEKVKELERSKKITDGLFGITKGPKDDPCHDVFIKDLEAQITIFASEDPDPEQVCSLLDYMYSIPLKYRDDSMIYWMFAAVHTLAYDLIGHLNPEDAQRLYQQYNENYPRQDRLPAQKKTLKALKNRS